MTTETPALTIRTITGHSKGCDRRAFVTIDGVDCMAGTMRAADVDAYTAEHLAINAAERIILTESATYAGCYSAAYEAGVKRDHREGAWIGGFSIGYYTAEAQREATAKLIIGEAGAALTAHYEAPAARRILRNGETLNVRLAHRDGTHTDLTATVRLHGGRVVVENLATV